MPVDGGLEWIYQETVRQHRLTLASLELESALEHFQATMELDFVVIRYVMAQEQNEDKEWDSG